MKASEVCSSVSVLLLLIIEHLWWNCCDASISHSQPELIEGDIVLDKDTLEIMKEPVHAQHSRARREAVVDRLQLWSGGVVPYVIDKNIDIAVRKRIRRAFRHISKRSCIRFLPKMKHHKDYVKFTSAIGCYSSVGRKGGEQIISVVHNCKYGAVHEVMHTLGFFHEQSRHDRDRHIKILWWNIQDDMKRNFHSYRHGVVDTLQQPYDLKSIMHYGNKAFSKNGGDTMISKKFPWIKLGAAKEKLSSIDTNQLNQLYNCPVRSRRRLGAGYQYNNCGNVLPGCFQYSINSDACESNYPFMNHYCQRSCGFC